MFDVGFLELMLIGVVGLLVLGPERLPKAARTVGLWIGKAKRTVSNMQRDINAQLEAEELRQKISEQEKKLNAGFDKARREIEGSGEFRRRDADHADAQQQADHEPVEPATTPVDPTPTAADKDSTPR